jgi:hypothetical protein
MNFKLLDIMLAFYLFSFHNLRGSIFFYFALVYMAYIVRKNDENLLLNTKDFIDLIEFIVLILNYCFFVIYFKLFDSQNHQKGTLANRFKKMMGLSEEGIAIVRDKNTIEYINDKFMH